MKAQAMGWRERESQKVTEYQPSFRENTKKALQGSKNHFAFSLRKLVSDIDSI